MSFVVVFCLLFTFAFALNCGEVFDFALFGGFDETADDMQFLTQWKFLDLRGLGHLLGCPSLMEELKQHVASEGFGQMRWYGAQRQTTRHSDGFDGQSEALFLKYWVSCGFFFGGH